MYCKTAVIVIVLLINKRKIRMWNFIPKGIGYIIFYYTFLQRKNKIEGKF